MSAILLSCAFVLGILVGCEVNLPAGPIVVALAPVPVLILFWHRRRAVVLGSLGLAVFIGGTLYSTRLFHDGDQTLLKDFSGPSVVDIRGMVCRDPETGPDTTRLHVSVSSASKGDGWSRASGTALLVVPSYPEYRYGDLLIARGRLETESSQGSDRLDYQGYLASQGASGSMFYPRIEVVERAGGSPIKRWIYLVRGRMSETIARILPEPHASLAQGITLGLRTSMPEDLRDDFSRTGTTHLLAISGVNLTIVAGMLVTIVVWLFGRRYHTYIWVTLAIVWLYAALTGIQPPVLRAAVMLSFFLVADFFGRQRSSAIALFLSAAIIVGFSPAVLLDVSFQLSVLAMAGLIFVCPTLQSWGRRFAERVAGEGKRRALAMVTDSLAVSAGAMAATWPLVAHYFGVFSWAGIPATFLTLPAMPAIIVMGMLSGGLGLAALPLGQVAAWVGWLPLSYLLVVVRGFAAVPALSADTGSFSATLVVAYYGVFTLAITSWRLRARL